MRAIAVSAANIEPSDTMRKIANAMAKAVAVPKPTGQDIRQQDAEPGRSGLATCKIQPNRKAMPQQRGKSGQANGPRYQGLHIKRRRWRDGRQCIEPAKKPAGEDDCRQRLSAHPPGAPPTQAICPEFAKRWLPGGFGTMLSDIDAPEQFPCQIARGRRTEEIGNYQSNHTRYPENHRDSPPRLHIRQPSVWSSTSLTGLMSCQGA